MATSWFTSRVPCFLVSMDMIIIYSCACQATQSKYPGKKARIFPELAILVTQSIRPLIRRNGSCENNTRRLAMYVTSRLISNLETLYSLWFQALLNLWNLKLPKTFRTCMILKAQRPLRIGCLPLLLVTLKQSVCFYGIYLYDPETSLAFQMQNHIHRHQLLLKLESNQRSAIKHTRVRQMDWTRAKALSAAQTMQSLPKPKE